MNDDLQDRLIDAIKSADDELMLVRHMLDQVSQHLQDANANLKAANRSAGKLDWGDDSVESSP